MKPEKFIAHRLDKDNVLYRGKVIELNRHIPTGYLNRYRIGSKPFTTQKQAKEYIDALCLARGIQSFQDENEIKIFIKEWV